MKTIRKDSTQKLEGIFFTNVFARFISPFAALVWLLFSTISLPAQSYMAINLGGFLRRDGTAGESGALAINNSGQVVGYARIELNGYVVGRATLFSGTGSENIDLGTLGGSASGANSISDAGQIVGQAELPGDRTYHATLFSGMGSGNTDLGTLGGSSSKALAINNSGQIVGQADVAGNTAFRATLFSGTGNIDLGSLRGSSRAQAINNSGQIVGYSYMNNGDNTRASHGDTRATLFSATGSSATDLGTLGGSRSIANGVNDAGRIAGNASGPSDTIERATIFSGTGNGNIDLGPLPGTVRSVVNGLNNAGQIVGNSYFPQPNPKDGPKIHGFIYSDGVMTDLNTITSGATDPFSPILLFPGTSDCINDWGQIAAWNRTRALLLDPVDPLTSINAGVTNIKFVGGMAYEKFAGTSETGGVGTAFKFLGGTAGSGGAGPYRSNRDVNIFFMDLGSNVFASDIVNLSGTAGAGFADTIVLQLTYDEARAIALFGSESAARLGWFDSLANQWSLAVVGNTRGSPFFAGDGAYDPAADFVLGRYGVDTASNTVWAVVNHDSPFAVVPEPSTFVLLALGMLLLFGNSFRARLNGA
ncbi:MAG TPA: PEP-CTERM sorting domain-containing protein [Terrimicrobiaceae bacterium]